jgi:hypothetical protein
MGLLNYLYKKVYGSKVERKYGWKKGDKYTKHCKMLLTVEKYHSNIKLVDLRDKLKFSNVIYHRENHTYCGNFQLRPDRRLLPDYFPVVILCLRGVNAGYALF